ncbi:MAG: FHA domain-containing protein [Pseudomonadota bacterium]
MLDATHVPARRGLRVLVCPKCGRQELGKATQCRVCGAALPFKTVLDMPRFGAAPERTCSQCQQALPVLATRCPLCHAPVEVRPDEVPTELEQILERPEALDPQQDVATELRAADFDPATITTSEQRGARMGTQTAAEIRAVFASSSDLGPPVHPAAPPAAALQETLVGRTPPPGASQEIPEHELETLVRTDPDARPDPQRDTDDRARQRLDAASRAVEKSSEPARPAAVVIAADARAEARTGPVPGVQVALQAPRRQAPSVQPAPAQGPPEQISPSSLDRTLRDVVPATRAAGGAGVPDPHSTPTRVYPAMASHVLARAAQSTATSSIASTPTDTAKAPPHSAPRAEQPTETDLKPLPPASRGAAQPEFSPQAPTAAVMRAQASPAPAGPPPPAAASSAVPTEAALPVLVQRTPPPVQTASAPTEAGLPLSTPAATTDPVPVPSHPAKTCCDGCGATLLPGTKFCHECGLPLQRPITRAFTPHLAPAVLSSPEAAPMRLVRVRGSEPDGQIFEITEEQVLIGRREGAIRFAEDPWTSPCHAQLRRQGRVLRIRDLKSRNGVFVRLHKPERLQDGDRICIGRQLLFYDESCTLDRSILPADDGQGTRLLASPRAAEVLRLVHLYASGAYEVQQRHQRALTLGRVGCDISFPDDDYLSSRHARVLRAGAFVVVEDLGSRNGTFVAIRGEIELKTGDEILIGNQVLRVEMDRG